MVHRPDRTRSQDLKAPTPRRSWSGIAHIGTIPTRGLYAGQVDSPGVVGFEPEQTHPLLRDYSEVPQRLIDTTIDAIDAGGEVSVRVQDIVAKAGVQITVLYRNFGSREGLVQAAQAARLRRDMDAELLRFSAAFDMVGSAEQFRDLVDTLLDGLAAPDRQLLRLKRVNVIGSTYGRPDLAAAVAQLQQITVDRIVQVFRPAQERGWIRPDLDLEAFTAWFAGQTLGRVIIELGDTSVEPAAFDAIAADAVRHVLFG